jgi:biotin carboxyl carrier protein
MKMENTVSAPVGGVIEQVNVTSGDRVFTGDELLKINRRPGE